MYNKGNTAISFKEKYTQKYCSSKCVVKVNASHLRENKARIKYTLIVKSAKKQTRQAFLNFL